MRNARLFSRASASWLAAGTAAMPAVPGVPQLHFALPLSFSARSQSQQQSGSAAPVLRPRGGGPLRSGIPVAQLPPAFDMPFWNEDRAKGYCLRVSYVDNCVVLTYIAQQGDVAAAAGDSTEAGQPQQRPAGRPMRGDRLVTVFLPHVYMARFVAVLEGAIDKCDIASRQTSGSFAAATAPHSFTLHTKSIVGKDTYEWTTLIDPAHALMLHRFISQAMHYNNGFLK